MAMGIKILAAKLVNALLKSNVFSIGDGCPPFLQRWTVIPAWITWPFRCRVFLHRFIRSDESADMHDHVARFISIGIKGRYLETTPDGEKEYQAPWVRTFPANYIHRIKLYPGEEAWTVVIIFTAKREWGFWKAGAWIHWREYFAQNKCE